MPGKSDVRMPCGRAYYCGNIRCRHAARCAEKGGVVPPPDARPAAQPKAAARAQTQKRPLAQPADVIFLYDGTLAGFYCCVHECVYTRQLPAGIFPAGEAQPSLFQMKDVPTDGEKAARVKASVPGKIGPAALELVETVFLSCMEEKELALLRFLLLGYAEGGRVMHMLGHPDVAPVQAAAKHLGGEAHLLLGFVRFSDYGGVLGATITPKNFILPFIANHFVTRYSREDFLIYDKTHKAALIYEKGQSRIVPMDGIEFPEADGKEQAYRALWKHFYNIISIEERYNPTCRRTHMPKRYWENMLEVQDLL